MRDLWKVAQTLSDRHEPFVVVTVLTVLGGAPQKPGAKAIVTAAGLHWGTIGGGRIEARAIEHSQALIARRARDPEQITWNLQRDLNMVCGGEATYLFEPHETDAWKITIFGAGHVGQAVVRALEPIQCFVTCIDPRPGWCEKLPQSPRLTVRCVAEPAECVAELGSDEFFVVMTQGHATDKPILEAIFRQYPDAPYVGAIGSDVKAVKLRAELKSRGISEELLAKLHCPIGLPVGKDDPAEIAISVVAELLQSRDRWRKS